MPANRRPSVTSHLTPSVVQRACAWALCTLAGTAAWAQTETHAVPRLSLAQAQQRALQDHPGVEEAASRARVAGFDVLSARARHLPRADLQTNRAVAGTGDSDARTASVSVNLWSGGAIEALVAKQGALFEAQRGRLQLSCADTVATVSEAYVRALRTQALADQATAHLAQLDQLYSMVEEIAKVDRGRRSDMDQVQTRRELVRLGLFDARSQARQALSQLQRVLGAPADVQPDGVADLADAAQPHSLADAQAQAMQASPALAAAQQEWKAAQRAVEVAKGARWPQINLVAEQARDRAIPGRSTDNRVLLQTQWNWFNGGQDMMAAQAAQENVRAAQSRIAEVQRVLTLDVDQAWDARQLSRERLGRAPEQSRAAQAVLETQRELFRLGKRTALDLLSAHGELNQVQVSRIEATHEGWATGLRLAALTARLLPQVPLPAGHACAAQGVRVPEFKQLFAF